MPCAAQHKSHRHRAHHPLRSGSLMAKKNSKKKPTAIQVWQPGTNVPGFDQYNELNKKIAHGIPEMARAHDIVDRQRPLLLQMHALLSQRPKGEVDPEFLF